MPLRQVVGAPGRPDEDHAFGRGRLGAPREQQQASETDLTLASHPGIVFSREALLSRVWPDHTYVTLRSVDTLVKRLRRRIEETPAEPALILTIWGSGYKFADV